MLFTLSVPAFAAESELLPEISSSVSSPETTVHYNIAGHSFDISYRQDGNIRTATIYESSGLVFVLTINDNTGVVTYNGDILREEVIRSDAYLTNSLLFSLDSEDNWTDPVTEVVSLSFTSYTLAGIVGYLQLKYSIMPDKAAYIAGLIIGAGGFLYVKSTRQYNYIDFSPKVGYRITESLHLTEEAEGESLFERTMTGSR